MLESEPDVHHSFQTKTCPVCEYSLRGLPAGGRCPECGFDYTHVRFRCASSRLSITWIVILSVLGIWLAIGITRGIVEREATTLWISLGVLLPVVMWTWRRLRSARSAIIVTSDCVIEVRNSRPRNTVRLSQVHCAQPQLLSEDVSIMDHTGAPLAILNGSGMRPQDLHALCAVINGVEESETGQPRT